MITIALALLLLAGSCACEHLHVVWSASDAGVWEGDWLKELFQRAFLHPEWHHVRPSNMSCYGRRMIVVAGSLNDLSQLPPPLQDGSCPFGLIHLSDEWLNDGWQKYANPSVKFALRNYYMPPEGAHVLPFAVQTFGLGYKRGFWGNHNGKPPALQTVYDRQYVWSFAGTVHHEERKKALSMFEQVQPHRLVKTSHFDAGDGLNITGYRDLMLSSVFVLAPHGHVNLDTFRLYEALEAGAIPVTLSHNALLATKHNVSQPYWPMVFAARSIPFIAEASWEEAYQKMKELLNNMMLLELRRQQVYNFWRRYKAKLALQLASNIAAHMPG